MPALLPSTRNVTDLPDRPAPTRTYQRRRQRRRRPTRPRLRRHLQGRRRLHRQRPLPRARAVRAVPGERGRDRMDARRGPRCYRVRQGDDPGGVRGRRANGTTIYTEADRLAAQGDIARGALERGAQRDDLPRQARTRRPPTGSRRACVRLSIPLAVPAVNALSPAKETLKLWGPAAAPEKSHGGKDRSSWSRHFLSVVPSMLKVTVLPFRTTPPAVRLREAVRSTTSPDLPLTVRLVGAAVTVKVPAPEVAAAECPQRMRRRGYGGRPPESRRGERRRTWSPCHCCWWCPSRP